jgi:flagellar basal-body rod protein FlgF
VSNVIYAALSRQTALQHEFASVANNIANASTTGFRSERHAFSEFVSALRGGPSLSQTRIGARFINQAPGVLVATNGVLDLAIEGAGFFVVDTPQGERLTRAGAFWPNTEGLLVSAEGFPVQSEGGGAISIPAGAASIVVSRDGVISVGGATLAKVRVVETNATALAREGSSLFRSTGDIVESNAAIRQGFLEASNVSPVLEIARMVEIQRAYEVGAQFIAQESDRIERAVETIGGRR